MRAVIDIPADIFNLISNGNFDKATDKDLTTLMRCFTACTILPKGHGDLIDRDAALTRQSCKFHGDCHASGSACDRCSDNCVEVSDIECVPIVVHADREDTEDS